MKSDAVNLKIAGILLIKLYSFSWKMKETVENGKEKERLSL